MLQQMQLMQRLRASRYWAWTRDAGVLLLVLVAIRTYQQRDAPSGTAPALEGVTLKGEPVSLASYRGAPVVLHFWATWCGVCEAEQGNLNAVARELPVLSVASLSGKSPQVERYVRGHGVVPAVVVDDSGALAKRFGVHSFPTTFVLDGEGQIRHVEVGYTTELGLRARIWLAR
jgi:thiol-disulfide isomerase/thioredoxin